MKNALKSSDEQYSFVYSFQDLEFRSPPPSVQKDMIPFPRIELLLNDRSVGSLLFHDDNLLPFLPIYEFYISNELDECQKEDVARRLLAELIKTRKLKNPPIIGSPEMLKGDFWSEIIKDRLIVI